MKPYIICHMVASVDGRIDCQMVDKISGDEYYATLESLGCPSSLEGRVTMAHYTALSEPFTTTDATPVGAPAHYKAAAAKGYHIGLDTKGTLRWSDATSSEQPLLVITSERAPLTYIDTLRAQGISYIVVGKDGIDLPQAMDTLYNIFGVERLALLGGGHVNGGFLAAGLIDEVSLLLAPGIDGRKGMTALFDGIADNGRMPTRLRLSSVEKLENDVLWLRYTL